MPENQPRSTLGPTIILVVLLGDVGLVIWGWYLHQSRQAKYSAIGLNLPSTPPTESNPVAPAAKASVRPDSLKFLVKDGSARLAKKAANEPSGPDAPRPYDPKSTDPHTRQFMSQASVRYFELLRTPRFKNSRIIQDWKRDFLSYPDLRVINARYHRDKDVVHFMADMLRSPNFSRMTKKYLSTQDIQTFVRKMAASPDVVSSGKTFLKDYNLNAAVKNLATPGIPSLGQAASQNQGTP